MTPVRFMWSAQHSFGLLRRHRTRRSFTSSKYAVPGTLTACRPIHQHHGAALVHTSIEGVNTPLDRQFGIAEQSLLRVKHGVCFGDPVPHTGFRASPIVQPRSQCLHTFHHTPNPTYATIADNLNSTTRFVFRERPSNNGKTFLFLSHAQTFNSVGHVFQNTGQVINCTCHRVQIIRSAQVMEHPTLVFHSITR